MSVADFLPLDRAIDGRLLLPDSIEYENVRKPPMARFGNTRPAAIALCRTPVDVAETIAFARRHGLTTATRSGGHSVSGRSSTDGILIDLTPMSGVSVADDVATVGAGVRLGALYDSLERHGITIPAGCGPTVGIGGLTLGGGVGVLGRRYGLTCDRLHRAEVVLADGRLVVCDERTEQDLFWALRGAGGGNFGVVTSFEFRTVPAPPTTVFHLGWPLASGASAVAAWQAWAPDAPDELDATLRLSAVSDGRRPAMADVFGVVLGSEEDATRLLGDLVARVGAEPTWALSREMPFREAKRYLDGLEPVAEQRQRAAVDGPAEQGPVFSKSEFFRGPLPDDAIAALVENLTRGLAAGDSREVAFLPWGGAYNRVADDATAFVHRHEAFLVQHLLAAAPGVADTGREWVGRSWAIVHPWGSGGVYPNFPDQELRDWPRAYYGRNYGRLTRVKAKYDPDNFFRFHQSVESASHRTTGEA